MFRRLSWSGGLVLAGAIAWGATVAAAGEKLVVHEWGTFTSLLDDRGQEIPGINIDDEPVPKFVHNLAPYLLNQSVVTGDHWLYRQKAAPRQHPQVAMRLETPVIYFYPPAGQKLPLSVDVQVDFRGGWLTEFYPKAKADAPGLQNRTFDFGELKPSTVSSLTWNKVQVGTSGTGPKTDEHVWTAPRKVQAAMVTADSGESERYLFYRGVANNRSPLRVATGMSQGELNIYANFDDVLLADQRAPIKHLWLVQTEQDGKTISFRRETGFDVTGDSRRLCSVVRNDLRKSQGGLKELQADMHAALVAEGLYADEATAMLSTWQRAYFHSPGTRMFYVVPRPWVDHYLPLKLTVSQPLDLQRVMIGRIELVTDQQRETLKKLAQTPPSDGRWADKLPEGDAKRRFLEGRGDFGDLGAGVPEEYKLYLSLGRFRNALVVAEERERPSANLTKFINTYALHPFRLPKPAQPARPARPAQQPPATSAGGGQ